MALGSEAVENNDEMIIAIDADKNNNNNTSNSTTNADVSNEQHRLLASTYPLSRQYSSPSVLDSSPKWLTTNSVHASSPPITEANNLTPIIRNTNNIQGNDPSSARTASLISPEAEADLRNMSIPLLSTRITNCIKMPQIGHDEILLTRMPRSFTNTRQYNCKLTSCPNINSNTNANTNTNA